jgi:hypothetical protein
VLFGFLTLKKHLFKLALFVKLKDKHKKVKIRR